MLIKRTLQIINRLQIRIEIYNRLKKSNWEVLFKNEGDIKIKIPKVSFFRVVLDSNMTFKNSIIFSSRPKAEVLLRILIYKLYKQNYISSKSSIIDIGSWIGDNTIVWANFLTDHGCVIAIDPSETNHLYSKNLASLNNIDNVIWVKEICADQADINLEMHGNIDHASFKKIENTSSIKSTTLDQIIIKNQKRPIGMIHVDVEGLELNVLKGAHHIIKNDMPVITFEQHISRENPYDVINFLKNLNYKVFLINEVLPGNDLDCRNFLALDGSKKMPIFEALDQSSLRDKGIFSATVGPLLIEL